MQSLLDDGKYPLTEAGFEEMCRHARMLGKNCQKYNAGDREWVKIGSDFSSLTENVIQYKEVQLQSVLSKGQ